MNIQGVGNQPQPNPQQVAVQQSSVVPTAAPVEPVEENAAAGGLGAVYEASATNNNAPNTPPTNNVSSPGVSVMSRAERSIQNNIMLLERMFGDQARAYSFARGEDGQRPSVWGNLSDITPEQAAEYVAEDGFWGVEQTSQRLFDMAVAISGGDERLMNLMVDAVNRGFEAAERVWGGELPQISHDTLAATMTLFDSWFAGR